MPLSSAYKKRDLLFNKGQGVEQLGSLNLEYEI
jgi:hypothetical protein